MLCRAFPAASRHATHSQDPKKRTTNPTTSGPYDYHDTTRRRIYSKEPSSRVPPPRIHAAFPGSMNHTLHYRSHYIRSSRDITHGPPCTPFASSDRPSQATHPHSNYRICIYISAPLHPVCPLIHTSIRNPFTVRALAYASHLLMY